MVKSRLHAYSRVSGKEATGKGGGAQTEGIPAAESVSVA